MASLYKKPVVKTDPKTGKKTKGKSTKWWGRYRNALGIEKRVPLAKDKSAAQSMLNELVKKVELEKAGRLDPFEAHAKRPLGEHVSDFKQFLTDKGNTDTYVRTTIQRVESVVDSCGFARINDVSSSQVQSFLSGLRQSGRSLASSNHYLRAIKMFSRWLHRDRRSNDDRLLHLSTKNTEADRRRVRRPLSPEELALLIKKTQTGPLVHGLSGPERVMIYLIAAYTGLRRNEIASVTRQSFDFSSKPATLTIEAGYSKRRRRDVIPLRSDLADLVKNWLTERKGNRAELHLFPIAGKRTAEMLQDDLKTAGIRCEDETGAIVDFHALRKTFITNLSRAGVSPKMAQTLARHSDINLTMNTYTTLGVFDQSAAVESLPPVSNDDERDAETSVISTTGTDGRNPASEMVPKMVPSGAENGARQLAANSFRIASICTEETSETTEECGSEDDATPGEIAGSGVSPPGNASGCEENARGGTRTPTSVGHWILNPARLPIPPLSQVLPSDEARRFGIRRGMICQRPFERQ